MAPESPKKQPEVTEMSPEGQTAREEETGRTEMYAQTYKTDTYDTSKVRYL